MPNDKEFELDDLESFSFDDLSLDESPSVAPPAAEADSSEDPFGVWVKSAPEDVAPAEDSLPEEDFLSSEELAKLDDSFDFVTVSEEPLEGETPLEDEIAFLDTPEAKAAEQADPSPADFDEVSLDDFVSFDDASPETTTSIAEETFATSDPLSEDDQAEEFLDIDIDIEDDIGDEELEIIEGAAPRGTEEAEDVSLDSFSAQDVDLSEFGDFEEVTPVAEGALAGAEDLPEVMELPDDLVMPSMDGEIELPEDGTFEETILDETPLADALPPLVDEGPVSLDLEPDDQTDLDHILALEEDLTSGIRSPEPEENVPQAQGPSADLAALILGKIEQELSSIKQEITELKKEMTNLRVAPPLPGEPPSPPEEVAPAAESKPHGFFDEEDDETIALTGDELDNILSTAEISEGEEQGLSLDEDLLSMDAEGNLVEPLVAAPTDALHVTDEEFLAGTALDLNEPDPFEEETVLSGIPESIELEEGLPEELAESETEDLLGTVGDDFEVTPLPEGLLEGNPEPLEIPFDEDIGLELEDTAPLAPDLDEHLAISEELPSLPELEDEISLGDAEGWSPPPLVEEPVAVEETLPPPPAPPLPTASSTTLSPGLKDELKAVLQYMDKLLASLPDDKIQEFAESEHFEVYKRLFEELGLIE